MADTVDYRFEAYMHPAHVSRIELESGKADWVYIRRQNLKLAKEHNKPVMLYVYNDYFHRWEYIGKAFPEGVWYDWNNNGPCELSADGRNFRAKKGGEL